MICYWNSSPGKRQPLHICWRQQSSAVQVACNSSSQLQHAQLQAAYARGLHKPQPGDTSPSLQSTGSSLQTCVTCCKMVVSRCLGDKAGICNMLSGWSLGIATALSTFASQRLMMLVDLMLSGAAAMLAALRPCDCIMCMPHSSHTQRKYT